MNSCGESKDGSSVGKDGAEGADGADGPEGAD